MILGGIDAAAHEAAVFAAIFIVVGGLDDLLVDVIYLACLVRSWGRRPITVADLEDKPAYFAIFVPAWDESAVIGAMLGAMLARWPSPDYRIYVGAYPNDRPTIDAVARVAEGDARVRLVVGPRPGPTTKADCLNALWLALQRDERAEGRRFTAMILHDAEDVVHPDELRVYANWIDRHEAVQVPVIPLRQPRSRLVSGHYLDEFAQSHGSTLLVRQALGASMPFAGVGCALRRDLLQRLSDLRDGEPFDAGSLTEDYELGLTVRAMGGRCAFVRVAEVAGGPPVGVRAYFPATVGASVRQKSRWMAGIALAGWDRTGWGRPLDLGDHWMRMRDRRITLAMPVLALAYLALVLWGASVALHAVAGTPVPAIDPWLEALLAINLAALGWRLAMRALLVGRAYGVVEALWSIPRMLVANYIALLAARRALWVYLGLLRGGPPRWDKTAHQFPDLAQAASGPGR